MPSLRPLLSLSLLLASFVSVTTAGCDKVYDEQGNEYDLSPLAGKDYVVEGHNLNGKMYIGVCENVRQEVTDVSSPSKVGVYLSTDSKGYSLGSYSNTPLLHSSPHTSLSLSYPHPDGNDCSSLLSFICETGSFPVISNNDAKVYYGGSIAGDCHHVFVFKTQHACPTSKSIVPTGGTGVWGLLMVFVSFVVTFFIVYFLTTVLYRRVVLGLRGKEQLPTLSGPFGWLKDMIVISFFSIGNLFRSIKERIMGQPTWGEGRRLGGSGGNETGWWNHQAQARNEGHFGSIRGADEEEGEEFIDPRTSSHHGQGGEGRDYWGRKQDAGNEDHPPRLS